MQTMAGTPQTKLLTAELIISIVSNINFPLQKIFEDRITQILPKVYFLSGREYTFYEKQMKKIPTNVKIILSHKRSIPMKKIVKRILTLIIILILAAAALWAAAYFHRSDPKNIIH